MHSISIKRLSLLAIFTLLLSGCATGGLLNTHKVKPESLATNGVLFGEFIGGTGAFRSMTMTGTFWLDISGVTYHVDKQSGAFAVSLAPGDYVLERITHESGSVRSSYDIKRRFSVRQGKITSLGGLFLIERDAPEGESLYGNKQGSFNIVQVDNEERAEDYFTEVMPEVYATLADTKIYKEGGNHISGEKLHILRRAIALDYANIQLKAQVNAWQPGGVYLVTANLGTAGWLKVGESGSPEKYLPFDLDSIDLVRYCDTKKSRYLCILSRDWDQGQYNNHLVYFDGKKKSELALPSGVKIRAVHLFGEQGVAVGDLDFAVYTKLSAASPWKKYDKEGVSSGLLTSDYLFQDDGEGFFTLYQGGENLLIKVDGQTGQTSEIQLPDFGTVHGFVSTDNHLLLGPEYKFLSDRRMYVYDKRSSVWSEKTIPGECVSPKFNQVTDSTLVVGCYNFDDRVFMSKDWGDSWTQAKK